MIGKTNEYWMDGWAGEPSRLLCHGRREVAWIDSQKDLIEWSLNDDGFVSSSKEDVEAALMGLEQNKKEYGKYQ